MTHNTTWLRCEVSAGQFSNERAVGGLTYIGNAFSLFAPADCVDDSGLMRVEELDRKGDLVLIALPAEMLCDGHRTITVRAEQLQPGGPHDGRGD